jgi:hypothetical protein
MSNPDGATVRKRQTRPRKKNALAHGIYGQDVLLPWESRHDFEKLLTELQDEFPPNGRMENEIVFDLAYWRWQKYRVRQMCIAAVHADPFVSDLIRTGQTSWQGLTSHLAKTTLSKRQLSDVLNEVFLERTKEVAKILAEALREGKVVNSQIEAAKGKGHLDVKKDFTAPLIEAFAVRPSAEDLLHRTHSPEYLERLVRIEAMIDARIDKALARLISIKEYKRVTATYAPPLIPEDVSALRPKDVVVCGGL